MINISESAKEALQTLMASIDEPIAGIRVLVKGGGCSGLQYDMALEEEKQKTISKFLLATVFYLSTA